MIRYYYLYLGVILINLDLRAFINRFFGNNSQTITQNPSTEDSKISPWTLVAKYKYKAEEELKKMEG